jgi:P pilus assembly chaperone PapD
MNRYAALFGALLAVCATQVAGAAPPAFKIDPITVTLAQGDNSALVSVINQGDTKIRFQITGSAWHQSADGHTELEPAPSLVFFPTVFTVDADETKRIRVGVTTSAADVERAYRLTIAQLPPLEQVIAPSKGAAVNTLLRVSIPVFVAPNAPPAAGYDITQPVMSDGALRFEFVNTGNVHVLLNGVEVVGKNATGNTTFDYKGNAWYVLAGGRRDFSFALHHAACTATRTLEVSFTSETGTAAQQPRKTFTTTGLNCANTTP